MPVSAEGRVEHQKLNQVAGVFGVQLDYSCRLKSASATDEKRVRQYNEDNFFDQMWCSFLLVLKTGGVGSVSEYRLLKTKYEHYFFCNDL